MAEKWEAEQKEKAKLKEKQKQHERAKQQSVALLKEQNGEKSKNIIDPNAVAAVTAVAPAAVQVAGVVPAVISVAPSFVAKIDDDDDDDDEKGGGRVDEKGDSNLKHYDKEIEDRNKRERSEWKSVLFDEKHHCL